MSESVVISVNLSSEQVKDYYKGIRDRVRVKTNDGQNVSVPYNILLDFLTPEGIYGTFKIFYGSDGKFRSINRVS